MTFDFKRIGVFQDLEDEEAEKLQEIVTEVFQLADRTIFKEGEPSDSFYIVKSGSVKIVKVGDGSSPPKVLAFLKEGDFFGEMGVMKDSPRSASAITMETSYLYKIGKNDLLRFLEDNPTIAIKIRTTMIRRYSDNVFALSKRI